MNLNTPHKMYFSRRSGISLVIDREYVKSILRELDVMVPVEYERNRYRKNGPDYHITVIATNEFTPRRMTIVPDNNHFRVLGYVEKMGLAFLVCDYPAGERYRSKYGLPSKNFHITLGYKNKNNHEIDKSFLQIRYKDHVYSQGLKNFEKVAIVNRLNGLPRQRRWCCLS